jgi:hypothetical protein
MIRVLRGGHEAARRTPSAAILAADVAKAIRSILTTNLGYPYAVLGACHLLFGSRADQTR